jgi:hypothetical protein
LRRNASAARERTFACNHPPMPDAAAVARLVVKRQFGQAVRLPRL